MKRALATACGGLVLGLGLGTGVPSAIGDTVLAISNPQFDTLTPIDSVPSSQQITNVFNNSSSDALAGLQQLANPPVGIFVDRGVQLRSVRALIHYCAATPCAEADPAHVTLLDVELAYRNARSGSELLVLRAVIESLGVLRIPSDLGILKEQLQHPSRDIRAVTARALRDLGNTNAIPFLRARFVVEEVEQVQTALSDALRVLGQQ